MDQELKAFLEEQFAQARQEVAEQLAQAEQRTAEKFAQAEQRTAEQFAQAEQRTAEQFAQAEQRTAEQFAQAEQRTAEQFVQVEQRAAEQFTEVRMQLASMDEKINLTQVSMEAMRSDLRAVAEGVMALNERLEVFQEATEKNFKVTEASIAPYYKELNGRVRVLEAKAERKGTDVLKAIYKKFGKTQGS
jgi:ABC-type molybdate transport system ATPase subunit